MITNFHIFESQIDEGLTMSAPTKKVFKIFRKKFPDYYIGMKSGGEESELEITSGREETVSRIKEIEELCNVLGWFISHGDGKRDGKNTGDYYIYDKEFNEHTYDEVIIKPKFDPKNVGGKPSIMYHVTPRRNVDKILKIGLVPKNKDKQAHHPERVYLTDSPELAWGLKKEFERIDGWKCEILKVSMKGLNVKLYSDVDARTNGFYTLENIPPQFISILPESEYKKHWSWKDDNLDENFVIKDINLFDKTQTDSVRKPSHKLMSWDEIYKTHKGIKWSDYSNGFDSVQDYFKKFIEDTL